ncbi:MAG: hypothetical protein FJX35_07615 [Alphaproteobacteria bacterium]|nr:hypothetical protein [Alphaproteobacteria bacterium]
MTKLLGRVLDLARKLPPEDQNDIARTILQLAGSDDSDSAALSPDKREAICSSKAAAAHGEFASDEVVRAEWAMRGL